MIPYPARKRKGVFYIFLQPPKNSVKRRKNRREGRFSALWRVSRVRGVVAPPAPLLALLGAFSSLWNALAAVELGKTVARDEARLRAAYDLTLREIALRLKGESERAYPRSGYAVGVSSPSSASFSFSASSALCIAVRLRRANWLRTIHATAASSLSK